MLIGLLKWFHKVKLFGVVGTPDEEEYFLHINSFTTYPDQLSKGTPIVFSPKNDKTKNRKSAESSRLVGNPEDWKIIFSHLGKKDGVAIEFEVTKRRKGGYPYIRKEVQPISLIEQSLKYFFHDKNEEEISNIIIDYFENDLDSDHFIPYCELIENSVLKYFSSDISTIILNNIFSHFGLNMNEKILFNVWKQKKFRYISYSEMEDIEIPESVLKAHILEVEKSELIRIIEYSYGSEFCSYYVNNKFRNIENISTAELKELYQFIEFEKESEQETRKRQLDDLYVRKIEVELTEMANQLGIIKNIDDFNNYYRLLQHIPNQFNDADITKIIESLHKVIAQKSSDEYKPELWQRGIINELEFESISEYFLKEDTQKEKQILTLAKLSTDKQFELLKIYSEKYQYEKSFSLISELVREENKLGFYFDITEVLFDIDFWKDKKSKELVELFTNYINDQNNDEQKYKLFLKGYVKNVPQNIVQQKIPELGKLDCQKIFNNIPENKDLIKDILIKKASNHNIESLSWLYSLANDFLDQENFNLFDKYVFSTTKHSIYFNFWEIGQARIFPKLHIEELLQDDFKEYIQIDKWIKIKATTTEEISEFLFSFIEKQDFVIDRKIFYKQLNHIKCILQLNGCYIDKIKDLKNNYYDLILWVLDADSVLDFEQLKHKFIYFEPDEQVRIVKKLFFLKANDEIDLTVEELNELIRFDLDSYKTNLKINPDIPIDISTEVIIKSLLSYKQNKRFLVENELLEIVLNDLKNDKTKRLRLSNYFEECLGREIAVFRGTTNGKIRKIGSDNIFHFAIIFSEGISHETFYKLRNAVKRMSLARWDELNHYWRVPSRFESEVLNFAKEYRLYLDYEGDEYANNVHLAHFIREGTPKGITFCEGRLANSPHGIFNKAFWWCSGQPCLNKCETIHKIDEWENYSMLDFCEVLGFNTDEITKRGDHIPKGHYYQFIALINRFNLLLEKLYCRDCNHILYPIETTNFGAHNVVKFHCTNPECSNNQEVYLNHCLNGICPSIIDSRDSERCPNGWFICANCGSCCSNETFKRTWSNLKLTGGYISDNLIKCLEDNLGHKEKNKYYCYKCKSEMIKIADKVFKCPNCNVKYDNTKNKVHNNEHNNDIILPF